MVGHIFISHVEENADVALGIADGLEDAGYGTWCYERDALPGPSYLLQTARQIEASAAVVLLISPDALGSNQVTAEVVRAHESAKPFVPVLIGISHVEFAARQPEWREALGSSTSIALPAGGVAPLLPRIIDGLRGLGVTPGDGDGDATARSSEPHVYRVMHAPAPTVSTGSTGPAGSTPARRTLLVGAGVAVAVLLLLAVGVIALGGGGGGDDGSQDAQDAGARTATPTSPDLAGAPGVAGNDGVSGGEQEPQQFASATDTPVATSAGSLRVASAVLTTKSCPPAGIPGECLSASGSDRYLVLRLAPTSGGKAALSQVFLNESHESSLSFGGGLQAGNFRISLDERANEIEIVYGVLSTAAADSAVLLHWPANQALLLAVTA